MKKILLIIALFSGAGGAQQPAGLDPRVPPEVQKIIDESLSGDGKGFFSHFDHNKINMGCDSATKLSDVNAGSPIIFYLIPEDSIRMINENIPVSLLINQFGLNCGKGIYGQEDKGKYDVPLMLNGNIVCFFYIWNVKPSSSDPDQWKLVGWGGGNFVDKHEWQKVISKWPNSKGYYPIIISIHGRSFVYVPEKNDNNLTLMRNQYSPLDSLTLGTDSSFSSLSDSRKVLKYLETLHGSVHSLGGNSKR